MGDTTPQINICIYIYGFWGEYGPPKLHYFPKINFNYMIQWSYGKLMINHSIRGSLLSDRAKWCSDFKTHQVHRSHMFD